MLASAYGSKMLFALLLNLHSPETFRSNWERRYKRSYSTAALRERHRDEYLAMDPPTHRYNDLAGFAEVYEDGGTRILVQYHLRGLKRRRFSNAVTAHWGSKVVSGKFYPIPYQEIGGIPHRTCTGELKRQAVLDALESVQATADTWGCFLDLTTERRLLETLDGSLLFLD